MSKGIPEHIDLMRAANLGGHFKGTYNIASMKRLSELLADKKGQITVDVLFGINEQNRPYFKGRAVGQLQLPCQRCMEAISNDIDISFELILVSSEYQSKKIEDDCEVLVVDTVPASFVEIVEDELLLSFPSVYMHEPSECNATKFMQDNRRVQLNEDEPQKENPFDALKDLKLDG